MHFNTKHDCISCAKIYTRLEDFHKHSKECLRIKLEDRPQKTIDLTSEAPSTSTDTAMLASDLALSDSNTSIDTVSGVMGQHLESTLTNKPVRGVCTKTDSSCLTTCEKSTQTDPLIVFESDEAISFKDGLTVANYQKAVQIFIDTVGSEIMMTKPNLSIPAEPTSQIGLLKIQPCASKGNQKRKIRN